MTQRLCDHFEKRLGGRGGIIPTSRKALKINGRIRCDVVQDYLISVPLGKRDLLGSGSVSGKAVML